MNSDVELLYQKTDEGLQIMKDFCDDVVVACGKSDPMKYMFSYSDGDDTPSAHLYKKGGMDHWIIKDFSSGESFDPIDVFCRAMNLNRNTDFHQVMVTLKQRYGIESSADNISNLCAPRWDDKAEKAPEGAEEGEWIREYKDDFSDKEMKIWGKKATREILKELRWHSVEKMGKVKNGMVKYFHSTEYYPIFARECKVSNAESFWKIYCPLAQDKARRFTYHNEHKTKTSDYINNFEEYIEGYKHAFSQADEERDNMPLLYTRGPVLCCGERDSVACRAMGWWPIWMNSETADMTTNHIRRLKTLDRNLPIYYIPDLDTTGQNERNKIANMFPELYIVKLPDNLKKKKDNRGKYMKDLRDWVESEDDINPWKFDKLMETAVRVQFWNIYYTKNGDKKVTLDTSNLHFLLETNGYYPVQDEDMEGSGGVEFGHRINDFIIEAVENKDVKDFVLNWCSENLVANIVRNQLMDGVKLTEASLMNMITQRYNFIQHDNHTQKIYFRNVMAEITEKGITLHRMDTKNTKNETGSMIWKKTVIDRDFRYITHEGEVIVKDKRTGKPILDDNKQPVKGIGSIRTKLFTYNRTVNEETGEPILSIDINEEAFKSKAFCTISATSHIYWQHEEEKLKRDGKTPEEIAEYWQKNWCRLDSPMLTEDQIYEQKASLISKLFIIGYYGWDYNSQATPWAAFVMDDYDGEGSNGGSGKSLLFDYIDKYKEVISINGRKGKKNEEDKHIFGSVTPRTRVIHFDDFVGDFSAWYKHISSGVTVEPKLVNAYTIPPEKSPKLAFTSNYVNDRQGSSRRRQILTTCSSFFHSEGGQFTSQSTPSDYLGGTLWRDDYTEEDWRYDDNIFITCIEEAMPYIQQGIKLEPPMDRAELRKLHNLIGRQSIDFFDEHFCLGEPTHANCLIPRPQFLADYKAAISEDKRRGLSDGDIIEKLAMWCAYRSWIVAFNPKGVPGGTYQPRAENSNKYNKARLIMSNPDRNRFGDATTIEAIYVANIDNNEPNLAEQKKNNAAFKKEREEIQAGVQKAMENPDAPF